MDVRRRIPIAWTVSHLLAGGVAYFLVATPIALVLRALGRDPMRRSFDRRAPILLGAARSEARRRPILPAILTQAGHRS